MSISTESLPHGVVVPIPTLPVKSAPPETVSVFAGAAVPMPTRFVEKSYTNPLVSIANPPANVEVAVVDVAMKNGDWT